MRLHIHETRKDGGCIFAMLERTFHTKKLSRERSCWTSFE